MPRSMHRLAEPSAAKPPGVPALAARTPGGHDVVAPVQGSPLPLPHAQDDAVNPTVTPPDATIEQARRDIVSGKVDTDMRATPGLDADNRARMVPGPAGKTRSAANGGVQEPRSPPANVTPAATRTGARRSKRA